MYVVLWTCLSSILFIVVYLAWGFSYKVVLTLLKQSHPKGSLNFCTLISQADVNNKSVKLWLAKDTSISITTVSSCLNIVVGFTQHADFTFNYFTSPFTFHYSTAKNWEHYQNLQFFLATLEGFLNQIPNVSHKAYNVWWFTLLNHLQLRGLCGIICSLSYWRATG